MLGQVLHDQAKDLGILSFYQPSVASTNTWAAQDTSEEAFYFCDKQTAGKGRFDRQWLDSEQGGQIFMSYACSVAAAPSPLLPSYLGLCLREGLQNLLPLTSPLYLKLPNDLYYKDKKVVGLLCQGQQRAQQWRVIVGLGINMFDHPQLETAGCLLTQIQAIPVNFLEQVYQQIRQALSPTAKSELEPKFAHGCLLKNGETVLGLEDDDYFVSTDRRVHWRDL